LLRETRAFGLLLGARAGRRRAGGLGDTDGTCTGTTRSVGACCLGLESRGRLGLATKPLPATFVVAGGGPAGGGRRSAPDRVDAAFDGTAVATGSVVGDTTLIGAGASELPGALATGAAGSEIGTTESPDAPHVVEAGG
jgi:hypothetical protein